MPELSLAGVVVVAAVAFAVPLLVAIILTATSLGVLIDGDGRISLRYIPTNVEAHERLIARFKSLLDVMRCRNQVQENRHYWGGRLGLSGVAHQNGTVRFGTDPATSALDLQCKMHELDNLYVVDSSFFVSSTAVNPTLTIIANALRVAEHLADRLGSPLPAAERQPVPVEQPRVAATAPA